MSYEGPEASEALLEVVGEALGCALEMLDDDALMPFVLTPGKVRQLDAEDWQGLAADIISSLPSYEHFWVLVAEELEPESGPGPCLHVRAGQRGEEDAFIFEQHYRPKGWLRSTELVGELVCVGDCDNPL